MKKTDIRYPSFEEQISERKKLLEIYKLDMVYGQEALNLLANRKKLRLVIVFMVKWELNSTKKV